MNRCFNFLSLLIFGVLLFSSCKSQKEKYTKVGETVQFNTKEGVYEISAISKQIIRVNYKNGDVSGDAIHGPVASISTIPFSISEDENRIFLDTDSVRVIVELNPFNIQFQDRNAGSKLSQRNGFYTNGDTVLLSFNLEKDEAIYGTGSRAIPHNRRGYSFMNYNQPQYGYSNGATEINYNIPHIYSSKQYMLLIDNPAKSWFDIGDSEDHKLEFKSMGGNTSYYFINGSNYELLINEYTELTGKQQLVPLWALGNLHSRFGYRTREEVEKSVENALKSDYPLDAVILDIYWFGPELEDGQMGRLDWDLERWPDPQGMIDDFHKKEIRVISVSEPFFTLKSGNFEELAEKGLLATDSTGNAATIPDFYFGEAGLLDIFKPEAKSWVWEKYKNLRSTGIDGFWVDLGEPEKHPEYMNHVNGTANEVHGIYGHEWAKMLTEGYKKDYPNERIFHLARAGFAGTQRYNIIPWSGDISRSWGGLQAQLPILQGMGISGLGYMHSDAGGFSMVDGPDEELYIRWLQFAAFTPIFRPHADAMVPPEPVYWPNDVQAIVKPYVQLRYDLLPYNYTLAWQNEQTGMPMMRAMFIEDSNISDTVLNQFMWGDDILVSPVLYPGQETNSTYLPEGTWYGMWDNNKYEGGRWIEDELDLKDIPVYVKEGSLIAKKEGISRTSELNTPKLKVQYFLSDKDSESYYYFDDGKTPNAYERGEYELLKILASRGESTLEFDFISEGDGFEQNTVERIIELEIIGLESGQNISISSSSGEYKVDNSTSIIRFSMEKSYSLTILLDN